MEIKHLLIIAAIVFIGAYISPLKAAELEITPREGELWVTATGELMVVNMTAVKGAWEEHAIKLEDGEVCIVIGELVEELTGMEGREVTLTGVLKPRMRYGGKLVRTIEIKTIDDIAGFVSRDETPAPGVRGLVTIKGTFFIAQMSNVPENKDVTQPAIKTEEDEIYLLVGRFTQKELKALENKQVIVTGNLRKLMPTADAAGVKRKVLWLEKIEKIEEESE